MNEVNNLSGVRLVIPFTATPPLAHVETGRYASSGAPEPDRVELSAAGTALAELREDGGLQEDRGVRIEKVARIRSEIQAGVYNESGKLEAVLDRVLADVLA